eukprot:CAMPEP_0114339384 /NCGR_PEP_ID=MMETSP0101-20121206/7704_1 /TAXON_ID=38822 ORGANISM="Pteridomonas danica, Strain PT" /NCGR_SAMPLE_ID=MMETSP0101 /ASSEMBLY_ACC=CAM_ASM_000211 /LENGTH=63 /DNA_ID=CAMNT_0001472355 /DNA_START=261 /DNA_END=452 /DNA_ORIENTATION=-
MDYSISEDALEQFVLWGGEGGVVDRDHEDIFTSGNLDSCSLEGGYYETEEAMVKFNCRAPSAR